MSETKMECENCAKLKKLYYLAAQDVIFFSSYDEVSDSWPDTRYYAPCVLLNDTFSYASADGELLTDDQIDRLNELRTPGYLTARATFPTSVVDT